MQRTVPHSQVLVHTKGLNSVTFQQVCPLSLMFKDGHFLEIKDRGCDAVL